LSGEPDPDGKFPNLKTLRDFVERTGKPIDRYRFDVQVGGVASDRERSRIFPEEHHLAETEERIAFEEEAFAADRRGTERPRDRKLNGNGRPTTRTEQRPLFEAD
jgi:adenine-specific DNA-methyltransferase